MKVFSAASMVHFHHHVLLSMWLMCHNSGRPDPQGSKKELNGTTHDG